MSYEEKRKASKHTFKNAPETKKFAKGMDGDKRTPASNKARTDALSNLGGVSPKRK